MNTALTLPSNANATTENEHDRMGTGWQHCQSDSNARTPATSVIARIKLYRVVEWLLETGLSIHDLQIASQAVLGFRFPDGRQAREMRWLGKEIQRKVVCKEIEVGCDGPDGWRASAWTVDSADSHAAMMRNTTSVAGVEVTWMDRFIEM
ncbi:hypothetical protein FPV67DRAFT_1787202 [Lyophyllum atratum]|nr:hypothetical protein FPV67DRAFT_1787202 [Lyophyllum atratum]